MDKKDIEEFFNHYKNSINAIIKLENRLLKESYSYRKWSVVLREKSRTIRKLYVKNEELRSKIITSLENNPDQLNNELAETYITHIDFFTSEGYRDYGMITHVIKLLLPFYEKEENKERIFDCCFFIAIEYMAYREFRDAELYFNKAISMYSNPRECEIDYKIYRMMCSYYFRTVSRAYDIAEGHNDPMYQKKFMDYVERSVEVWTKDIPIDFMTDTRIVGFLEIVNGLVEFVANRLMECGKKPIPEISEYIEKEYVCRKNNGAFIDDRDYVVYNKLQLNNGCISEEQYVANILDRYREYQDREFKELHRDNRRWDIISLFDDEVKEEDFSSRNLYYMSEDYVTIFYLLTEVLSITDDEEEQRKIFGYISFHLGRLPYINGDYIIDYIIQSSLSKMFTRVNNVDMILNVIENFYVYRQTVTVIHSAMVSRLASVITERLIDNHGELFVGLFDTENVDDVLQNRDKFISYAEIAGKCHDVGKIVCTDIITLQSRRIVDDEFLMIKNHPAKGGEILHQIHALKDYVDIALGHQKWHNGKNGYPMEFDNTRSKYRIFIDIIQLCDCIDAATDTLGRNYAKAKDFYQVLDEFARDKGSMYSPEIVDYICKDEELVRKIYEMTLTDREMACYEVYRNFIERRVDFMPKNEKYVRMCKEDDVEELAKMNMIDEETQSELMRKCEGFSCVILDGYGHMYGSVYASYGKCDELYIEHMTVPQEYRRCGNGTKLMEYLESKAKKAGIQRIYVDSELEDHNDKFFWGRGYSYSGDKKYLEKIL